MARLTPGGRMRLAPGRGTQNTSKPGVMWQGLEVLANNINNRGKTLNKTRRKTMDNLAKAMEGYAKANAPWKDHTTLARNSLQGVAVHDEANAISTAYLSHGVPYGVFLETMGGGEFAIIAPTITLFQGTLLSKAVQVDSFGSILGGDYGGGGE